jgi:ADP-heptose:LPS heptosyltransferase
MFFKAAGLKKVVGGSPFRRLKPTTDKVTGHLEPEAEFLARSMCELGPIDTHDRSFWDLRLTENEKLRAKEIVREISGNGFLVASAGGKVKRNNWGYENWNELLANLSALLPGVGLFLAGSGDERDLCADLAASWGGLSVNGAGILNPRETAAVIALSRGFVGHDSGPLHLAAAMDIKCVGIFGDNNPPRRWHPYGHGHHVNHSMEGVHAISPAVVLKDVLELLSK